MNTIAHSFKPIQKNSEIDAHRIILQERRQLSSHSTDSKRPLNMPQRMRKHPTQDRSRMLVRSVRETVVYLATRKDAGIKLSIKTISDRSGVGHGSLYQYFNGLESILASVYEDLLINTVSKRGFIEQPVTTAVLDQLGVLDDKFGADLSAQYYTPLINETGSIGRAVATLMTQYRPWNAVESIERLYWQPLFD